MLKKLTLISSLAITVPLMSGCLYEYNNVVDAVHDDPELSILAEAVTAAELNGVLTKQKHHKNSLAPFTVFAPTNEAFVALLDQLQITKEDLFANKALLTKVLTYHVLSQNEVLKEDIKVNEYVTTVNGNAFTVNDNLQVVDTKNSAADIVKTDIRTFNGVVHVINKVLLPELNKNVVDIAVSNDNFSILVEALQAADLVETVQNAKDLTVFAPTNEAFVKLLAELDVTKEALFANKTLLTKVLTYHVLGARVYSTGLPASATTLANQDISFNGTTIIDANMRESNIVATDIQGTNGVVHVIDTVILPE